jgi:hypothetical protein
MLITSQDSEDEEMENEIDGNIDLLAGAAGRMKIIGALSPFSCSLR